MPRKRRSRSSEFLQGTYHPHNKAKCLNKTCSYRSSYELRLMEWLDRSANVIRWSSEKIEIPYISPIDGKQHRYYPDAYVELKQADGTIGKFIIEIKPESQSVAPVPSKRKKQKTILYEQSMWLVNQAKWSSCEMWCKKRGLRFVIVTEKHLCL